MPRRSRRHAELTQRLGENYAGVLHADGYEAYDSYARDRPKVERLGCWAHARNKFADAESTDDHRDQTNEAQKVGGSIKAAAAPPQRSGPWGTKITRLAEVARARGFEVMSPDYRHTHDPKERVAHLLRLAAPAPTARWG